MRVVKTLALIPLFFTCFASALTAGDQPALPDAPRKPLWRIGKPDDSCAEFGLVPTQTGEFKERFPEGVRVDAGDAEACRAFSALQPGLYDRWAGSAPRDFRISFQLQEPRDSVLLLWLTEVHDTWAPTLEISAGGETIKLELETGGGKLTIGAAEGKRLLEVPIPSTMLRAGANELTLLITSGCWIAYDALGLDALEGTLPPPELSIEELRPLPIVTADGQQLVRVRVRNNGQTARTQVKVTGQGFALDRPANLHGFSERWIEIEVPEPTAPTECRLSIGDGHVQTVTHDFLLQPPRHMEVHVLLAVHTDIGYTDLPEKVALLHCENLARMVEFCDRTDDWPAEVKPTYTIETGWQLEQFMKLGDPKLVKRLLERMREGRVVMNALYLNTLTGMATPEALLRLRGFAMECERKLGISCRGASQTDTPSYSWSLCSLLANTGVRYLSTALNQDRAWFERNTDIVPPFWWEAPDGKRVLTWFSYQYGQFEYGLTGTIDETKEQLSRYLERRFPEREYPWEMLLMHCYYADNRPLTFEPLPLMKEWNETYRWPRLYASTIDGFLSRFEQRYGDRIPVHRGDWGTYWEDGVASSARATAQNARNQAAIDQASRLASLAAAATGDEVPRADLAAAWDDILLYNEHTWGHSRSVSDPLLPIVREHWEVKAGCSTRPVPHIEAATAAALGSLDRLPTTGEFPALCVWNTLSWPRTGLVRARVLHDGDFRLIDAASGEEVAWQKEADSDQVVFLAEEVPPLGYKLYELRRGPSQEFRCRTTFENNVLLSPHHSVSFDLERGGIRRAMALASGRDLVDGAAPWRLGQVIYDVGEPPNHERHLASKLELVSFRPGPVFSTVIYRGKAPTCPTIKWAWSLYDRLDRIDLTVTIDKEEVTDKEALYVAFPFAAEEPTFHLETAFSSFVPDRDQLAGANRDWYTTVGSVSVAGKGGGIVWAPRDTPLVQLGDIQLGRMLKHLEPERPTILSYAMNNYWQTNYRAGQEPGEHVFEYSLRATGKTYDPVEAHRFGQEVQQPLLVRGLAAGQKGSSSEPARSLLSVEPETYALIGMERAADGEGTLLHLLQLAATTQEPRLEGIFDELPAERLDCVENPLSAPDPPTPFRVVTLRFGR
ncbi:MAG: hypothetical protein V2A76_17050 [Planctomycetota bacterium]